MSKSTADLIATAQHRTDKVQVCARGDLVSRHAELVEELSSLIGSDAGRSIGQGASPELERVRDEIEAVEAEMDDATVTYEMRALSPLRWANLRRQHLPRPGLDHGMVANMATFPPAAVSACVVTPEMTLEQAQQLYGTDDEDGVLHSAEWDKLWAMAWSLNEVATPHPKLGAAIGSLLKSGQSSTTQPSEESPDPVSSASLGEA